MPHEFSWKWKSAKVTDQGMGQMKGPHFPGLVIQLPFPGDGQMVAAPALAVRLARVILGHFLSPLASALNEMVMEEHKQRRWAKPSKPTDLR